MIGILLVTHNGLGESLVDCVRHVLGNTPDNLKVLSVLGDDDPDRKAGEGRELIEQLDSGSGVLLLTDLYGATPCNIARQLCEPGRVAGVAGVNLAMVLRSVCYSGKPLAEVMQKTLDVGRECVMDINSESEYCNVATGCTDN